MCYPTPIRIKWEDGKVQIPQRAKDSVVFIYTEIEGEKYPVGTGFFLHVNIGALTFYYLVTCKHVIDGLLDDNIYIRVNRKTGVDFVPIEGKWYFHEDEGVDLAVVYWQPKGLYPVDWTSLSVDDVLFTDEMSRKTNHQIGEGDDVLFIGLFAQYTGQKRRLMFSTSDLI